MGIIPGVPVGDWTCPWGLWVAAVAAGTVADVAVAVAAVVSDARGT